MLEPTDALESTENALRLVVSQLSGDLWQKCFSNEKLGQFGLRMQEEAKRRDGTQTSQNVLDFVDFTDLTKVILQDWETYKPVFRDQARLKAYFGIFEDVRNTIAHSRPLVPHERELLSGITKHIRNQIAIFRMGDDPASKYYPVIESVVDSFGRSGEPAGSLWFGTTKLRVNVGDSITLDCRASDPLNRDIYWVIVAGRRVRAGKVVGANAQEPLVGSTVSTSFTIDEYDVTESLVVQVYMHSGSDYRRITDGFIPVDYASLAYDDSRKFLLAVNPPIYF